MALVRGTNCGFVTSAPSADPAESEQTIDNQAIASGETSPATAAKIIEIGWWCDNATQASNFEVGLYAADGGGGLAGTLLYVDDTNAKGTSAGWKRVTVDWAISPSTAYWLAVQLDDTATATSINRLYLGGSPGFDSKTASTLPNPYAGGGLLWADSLVAIYAVWEAAAGVVKTVNGLPIASIKTINGLAVASVKTYNGAAYQ